MRSFRFLRAAFLFLLLTFVPACNPVVKHTRVAPAAYSKYRVKTAAHSAEEMERINRNCLFNMPKLSNDWNHGPTRFIYRDGYVLQHSSRDKIALWVCELVTAEQLEGTARRKNNFKPDPLLEAGARAELSDYKYSGYDRGHQAPAANQKADQKLNNETFYLSNMVPQMPQLNQQIWKELEFMVRDWVKARGKAYVITGGLFYDPEEEDVETADGLIQYYTIGENAVAVPTHFYKIVIHQDSNGQLQAIAFVLKNCKHSRPYDFSKHIMSIRWIEKHAGVDFSPDLDANKANMLENQKGSLSAWSGGND